VPAVLAVVTLCRLKLPWFCARQTAMCIHAQYLRLLAGFHRMARRDAPCGWCTWSDGMYMYVCVKGNG
jgi:hypothetical protein